MALDFPANPVDGQVYGAYVYSASKNAWQGKEEAATVATVSSTAPTNANNGDIWYNSSSGISYVYYADIDSGQWVELVSAAPQTTINKLDDINDVVVPAPAPGQVLSYDGGTQNWINTTIDVSATTIADTAPSGASQGDAWFDSSSGFLYIYYVDGTSSQWIEVKANSGDLASLTSRVSNLEAKADFPIQLNTQTISSNYTIPSGYNGMSAGPVIIADGVIVTIPDGSSWSIV